MVYTRDNKPCHLHKIYIYILYVLYGHIHTLPQAHKQPTLANVTFPAGPTWINGSTTTSKPPDDDLSSPHRYSQFSRSDYFKQGTVLAKRIPSLHILQDLHGTQKTGDPLPVGTPHNSSHIYTRGATNHQLNVSCRHNCWLLTD